MIEAGHQASEEELVQIIKQYDSTGISKLRTAASLPERNYHVWRLTEAGGANAVGDWLFW